MWLLSVKTAGLTHWVTFLYAASVICKKEQRPCIPAHSWFSGCWSSKDKHKPMSMLTEFNLEHLALMVLGAEGSRQDRNTIVQLVAPGLSLSPSFSKSHPTTFKYFCNIYNFSWLFTFCFITVGLKNYKILSWFWYFLNLVLLLMVTFHLEVSVGVEKNMYFCFLWNEIFCR